MNSRPRISVVLPGHNAERTIHSSIDSLLRALAADEELIYVDDGSTDATLSVVDKISDPRLKIVRCTENIGRGPARNRGAKVAVGDVLVFVDADVVVADRALELIREAFSDSGVEALFGSYDTHPRVVGRVSQYRNLLHHHTHHTSGHSASHFWTGLGAIRRSVFETTGGFNEDRWSRNMEEVEFGHRLTAAGHTISVRPDIEGNHLKEYSLISMIRTDLRARAIPWTQLLLSDHRIDRFVLSWSQRLSALGAVFVVLSLPALVVSSTAAGILFAVGSILFVGSNLHLWRFFVRERGVGFALLSVVLHLVHTLSAVLGFIAGVALHIVRRMRGSSATSRADAIGQEA